MSVVVLNGSVSEVDGEAAAGWIRTAPFDVADGSEDESVALEKSVVNKLKASSKTRFDSSFGVVATASGWTFFTTGGTRVFVVDGGICWKFVVARETTADVAGAFWVTVAG